LAEVTDQLTYWEGIHDQQVSTGVAAGHSQATIKLVLRYQAGSWGGVLGDTPG